MESHSPSHRLAVWTHACLALGFLVGVPQPASGLINPRFTPVDLVRTSAQILELRVEAPARGLLRARVVATLKGKALTANQLVFDISDAEDLTEDDVASAFGTAKQATGVLVLAKARPAGRTRPIGALQIGTLWFAVYRGKVEGKLHLDADVRNLTAVWAGSAEMLARATKYVLTDVTATFPVASLLTWSGQKRLGKLTGPARACIAANLGAPIGACTIVLSDAGDRIYQASTKGGQPTDVTDKLKLTTTSRQAALADFTGDGRLDLASWDGKALRLAVRAADGTFTTHGTPTALAQCNSLDALRATSNATGLVVGTPGRPVLLVPDARGGFSARTLPFPAEPKALDALGPGGPCAVADFDNDGRCDVAHLYAKGVVFYGSKGEGEFTSPTVTKVDLVKAPSQSVCGDYDANGFLDVIVTGQDGFALLTGGKGGTWSNDTSVTGELTYHGNANSPRIAAVVPCDINGDGRQSVAFFYPTDSPMVFFNRGFACFGLARKLALSDEGAPSGIKAAAVERGQSAGTMMDLNGDQAGDLLAVTPMGEVWALFGRTSRQVPLVLTVALAPKVTGPLTVAVSRNRRLAGVHVVRPGRPAHIGCPRRGLVTLEWSDERGKRQKRTIVVLRSVKVEL